MLFGTLEVSSRSQAVRDIAFANFCSRLRRRFIHSQICLRKQRYLSALQDPSIRHFAFGTCQSSSQACGSIPYSSVLARFWRIKASRHHRLNCSALPRAWVSCAVASLLPCYTCCRSDNIPHISRRTCTVGPRKPQAIRVNKAKLYRGQLQ